MRVMVMRMGSDDLCHLVKDAYAKIVNFRSIFFIIPTNEVENRLLKLSAIFLKWINKNVTFSHFTWFINIVLIAICLQIKNKHQKHANIP